ncbi:response regulator [Formosa algae]|uniref:CheY-like chemotaxis protein n=1 Tax=Formosa algae TaxID=225843 RepID=A0A9X1C9B0_9FLAO|nr:response regulator [Formosa algae]MBP1839853.1 CheY-like chemotaxis protein [Formosa algae]MDQ0335452.1 CheY-like chemotaxis protein [Formosa algae]OEI79028.1 transcriptional regulator [Formosa algae]PNW28070.1 response regulator [Formosa algae]
MSDHLCNIILVDDDEDDRMLFSEALDELVVKANVLLFKNGQELIDYLFQTDIIFPDLIFLDVNMPIKNGMECLRDIRNHPKLKDIRIAMYSTSKADKDINESFSNGASIYVNKPNSYTVLKKTLEKIIQFNWQSHIEHLSKDTFLFRI